MSKGLQLTCICLLRMGPAKLLLLGYTSYIILGWILLSLPFT